MCHTLCMRGIEVVLYYLESSVIPADHTEWWSTMGLILRWPGQLIFCKVRWPSILFCILVILTAEGFQEDPVSVLLIPCILLYRLYEPQMWSPSVCSINTLYNWKMSLYLGQTFDPPFFLLKKRSTNLQPGSAVCCAQWHTGPQSQFFRW